MGENTRSEKAIALTEGRLHRAVGHKRCGCGPCAHQITVAARQAGVRREQLEAALPPAARPRPRPRRQRRRESLVRICDSCTVRVRGCDVQPHEGLALLLGRMHS